MALLLRVRGHPLRPRSFHFSDDVAWIAFGRDPARCQVLFAERVRAVGREHCALERVLGTYRWVLSDEHAVYVNRVRAMDGDALPACGTMRIGQRGPRLYFGAGENAEVPRVRPLGRLRAGSLRLRALSSGLRWNRIALLGLLLLMLGLSATGAMAINRHRRSVRPDAEALLRAALAQAAPSVYRTVRRWPNGAEEGGATAWVVAPGILATNAHVAVEFERLGVGETMLVRSSGSSPESFEVQGVRIHPGFDAFAVEWSYYGPLHQAERYGPIRVRPAGGACDVALLEVASDAALGRPLPLASSEDLRALRLSDAVGYIGYPSENLIFNGSPVRRPVPEIKVGTLTAMTTFLGDTSGEVPMQLLHHSCPATGGSSGSPLIDRHGRVVGILNAGNFNSGFQRIPSGVAVNFAQRIDLLQELLTHRADALQAVRTLVWRERLPTLYARGSEPARDAYRERVLADGDWRIRPMLDNPQDVFVHLETCVIDVDREGVSADRVSRTVALPAEGVYAALIWQYGARTDGELSVRIIREGKEVSALPREVDRRGGVKAMEILASAGDRLEFHAAPAASALRYHVELFRSTRPGVPLLDPDGSAAVVAAWERQLGESLKGSFEAIRVLDRIEKLEPDEFTQQGEWYDILTLPGPGLYLFVAQVASGHEVEVSSSPAMRYSGLPEDVRNKSLDAWAFYAFQPYSHFVRVVGREKSSPGLDVRIMLFRAQRRP